MVVLKSPPFPTTPLRLPPPPPPPPSLSAKSLLFAHARSPCFRATRRSWISMALPLDPSSAPSPPPTGISVDAGSKTASSMSIGQNDLLIVGPGVLGRIVADMWRKEHSDCQIFGQTRTTDHHDELVKIGIIPSLSGMHMENKFPYVIFCAPPSHSADYPGDLRLAASSWNGEGSFVFTSSSAVFDRSDNGVCNEDCPVVPIGRSRRTDVLLKAENEVLEHGGCVLRLVGLYKADRGAHSYWLEKGTVDVRPDHILNLIHYEDAASLAITIMKKNLKRRIFVGCDNHPLSRQELMDCVNQSGKFSKKFLSFTGTEDPLGKRIYNSKTRAELEWEPKYASFSQFLEMTY